MSILLVINRSGLVTSVDDIIFNLLHKVLLEMYFTSLKQQYYYYEIKFIISCINF